MSGARGVAAKAVHRFVRCGLAAGAAAVLLHGLPAPAGEPAPRGSPASRIANAVDASEYWDLAARFETGHSLFVRFMITNEGPGEKTGIAYGHFIEPNGTAHAWQNGRQQQNWTLGSGGLVLDVGSSDLDLTGPPYHLRVHKKKKGIDIELQIAPEGPAVWDRQAASSEPAVDLLAGAARVTGTVFFRELPAPLELSGRGALTHTWMERSEPALVRRRIDFYSLQGDTAVYLHAAVSPEGVASRWLHIARAGKTLFESRDFELRESGRSAAERAADYPLPAVLQLAGKSLAGEIKLGVGVLHHDPMEVIPQPFRFLLSFKMRPQRAWIESPFEVTVTPAADPVRIRGTGITNVTYLNPALPPR